VRRTEARRARGARLGALLLVLARRSALLGLLRLPSGLVPPAGGMLRGWRHFHFSGFGSTLVTLLVWDPHKFNFFLVWIHTREGGSGYLPGKKLPMRGIVLAAERRGRLSQGRNAVVHRDDRPWSAGTIGRGPQGRNAVVRWDETPWCAGHECRRGK